MTSINPDESEGVASSQARGRPVPPREMHRAPDMDPVHPESRARAVRPVTTATAEPEPPTTAEAPAPAAVQAPSSTSAPAVERLASVCGTPAVLNNHVVALEAVSGAEPMVVHVAEGHLALMPLEVQVWARAGRMTVVAHDSSELRFTVLGAEEGTGLRLGERWPHGESESRAKRMATAAVRDVGEALTFPAWLARSTRISGQRNVALHSLIKRLRHVSPGTAVFYGQTFGFEHHRPTQAHPYDHRGIVGKEGYPTEL
jgi:hypothetical protein